jgi:hypothetical protein
MEPFETDLFISYAHIDNRPLPPEQEGWISRFHLTLAGFLGQYLGRDANIRRDRKPPPGAGTGLFASGASTGQATRSCSVLRTT